MKTSNEPKECAESKEEKEFMEEVEKLRQHFPFSPCTLGDLEENIRKDEELRKATKYREFISSLPTKEDISSFANEVVDTFLLENEIGWCDICNHEIINTIGKGYLSAPLEIGIIDRLLLNFWKYYREDRQKFGKEALQYLGEALKRTKDENVKKAIRCVLSTLEAERQDLLKKIEQLESVAQKLGFEIRKSANSGLGVKVSFEITYDKNEQSEEMRVSLARLRELADKAANSNPLAKDGTSIDADKLTKRPVPAKPENKKQKIKR